MDVMLQRHCARYIYVVPDGLRELMSDISREVLRSQPEDIYTFIADYLDALLITRENARISAKFVVTMTDAAETIVELLDRSGMTRSAADHAAEVIQEAFRNWSSRKGILKEDEDALVNRIIEEAGITELQAQEAAVCIQHAFHAFKMRQQREQELLGGTVDWRVAARSAIRLYRRTGVSPEEAKKAANTIKAAYKGYYTRRALQKLNEVNAGIPGEEVEEEEEEYENFSASSAGDKKKGVRIDFATIQPHVDFGGEELIEKDIDVIAEDDHFTVETLVDQTEESDVMKKIFGGTRKGGEPSSESFIRGILDECFKSAVIRKYEGRKVKQTESIKEEETLDPITKEDEEFQQGATVAKEIIEKLQEGRASQQSQLISQTTEKETVEDLATTATEKEDSPTEPVEPPSESAEPVDEPEQPAEVPEQPPAEEPEQPPAEEPEQPSTEETKPPDEEEPERPSDEQPIEEQLVEETKPPAEQPAEEPEQLPVEEPPANEETEPPGDDQTVPPAEEPPKEKPEETPPEAPPQHPESADHDLASVLPESKSAITESSVLV